MHRQNKALAERRFMLGVKSKRQPITGKYAEELRATLKQRQIDNLDRGKIKSAESARQKNNEQ